MKSKYLSQNLDKSKELRNKKEKKFANEGVLKSEKEKELVLNDVEVRTLLNFNFNNKKKKPKKPFSSKIVFKIANEDKNSSFAYWEKLEEKDLMGMPLEDLRQAFNNPENDSPIKFDDIYEDLKLKVSLEQDEFFSYIGNGKFGVLKSKKGKVEIVKTVDFEKENATSKEWQDKIKFKLNRTKPVVFLLKNLYNEEEIKAFPKLGSDLLVNFMK